jgi:hypothetical protein
VSIILFAAAAELITEVVVVRVTSRGFLRVNTFLSSLGIFTQCASGRRGQACGSAVADEIAFVEEFN